MYMCVCYVCMLHCKYRCVCVCVCLRDRDGQVHGDEHKAGRVAMPGAAGQQTDRRLRSVHPLLIDLHGSLAAVQVADPRNLSPLGCPSVRFLEESMHAF